MESVINFPWLCTLTDYTNVWYLYKSIYVLINTHISVIYLNIDSSGAHSKAREIVEEGLKRSLNGGVRHIKGFSNSFLFCHPHFLQTWLVVYCPDKAPKCVGFDLKVITLI